MFWQVGVEHNVVVRLGNILLGEYAQEQATWSVSKLSECYCLGDHEAKNSISGGIETVPDS